MGAGTDAWWDFGPSEFSLDNPSTWGTPTGFEDIPFGTTYPESIDPNIIQKIDARMLSAAASKLGEAGAKSLFQRIMSEGMTEKNVGALIGALGPGLAQEFFASQRGNQLSGDLRGIAEQARADRWPFLDYSLNLLKGGPEAYAAGPGAGAVKGILSGLSARAGNPYDNPGSIMRGSAELGGLWQNAVTGFGNIGLAGQDTRSGLLARAAEAGAPTTGAGFGDAMASVFGEKQTLANLLKQLKDSGMIDTEWSFA